MYLLQNVACEYLMPSLVSRHENVCGKPGGCTHLCDVGGRCTCMCGCLIRCGRQAVRQGTDVALSLSASGASMTIGHVPPIAIENS